MKKQLLLFAMLSSIISLAQNTNRAKEKPFAQFGVKAGLNLANVKTDLYPGRESRKGLHAGGFAHIHLSKHLAVQPEVMYSQQGFNQMISTTLDVESKIDYLNVPLLIQYMYRGVRVESGPQIGFLLNSRGEYSDGREEETEDYLKPTDFSWLFGASFLSPYGIGVHARYNLGISNINAKITAPGVTNTDMQNQVWQFGLFYQFKR